MYFVPNNDLIFSESSIHFEELMATAAADARGTTCASSNGNKGIVSSSSSNFPLASSRSNVTPSNVAPSNNLTYLTNMNRVNAQQGNPAFHDLPQRGNINQNLEKPEDLQQISQQQRFGSLEDCSVLGNRTPPPPPPPANGEISKDYLTILLIVTFLKLNKTLKVQ